MSSPFGSCFTTSCLRARHSSIVGISRSSPPKWSRLALEEGQKATVKLNELLSIQTRLEQACERA